MKIKYSIVCFIIFILILFPSLGLSKTANSYYKQGLSHSDQGNYEIAIQNYNKAIELKPNFLDAYLKRGLAYHFMEKYNQAILNYNKAIELDSKNIIAYHYRAASFVFIGNYELQLKDFNKIIQLAPDDVLAHAGKGHCYFQTKDYKLAIQEYTKVIELKPDQGLGYIYFYRGKSQYFLGNNKSALKDINKAIEIDPNISDAIKFKKEIELDN